LIVMVVVLLLLFDEDGEEMKMVRAEREDWRLTGGSDAPGCGGDRWRVRESG